MNSSKRISNLIVVTFLLLICLIVGLSIWNFRSVKALQDNAPRTLQLISEVPGVEIKSVEFAHEGKTTIVVIENRTDKDITGYTLSCGDFSTTYDPAIRTDDLIILAAPGESHKAKIASDNLHMREGQPLVLSAVLFADGTAQGLSDAVEHAKRLRIEDKERRYTKERENK